MSDQTKNVPPVPVHTPPVDEKNPQRKFNVAWERWFLYLREKVNVINQSLISLGLITNVGFLAKQTDGSWASRTLEGSDNIIIADGDGSDDPQFDLTETGVAAGTYGDATHVAVIEVDEFGRVQSVTEELISGGGGGGGGDGWTTAMLAADEVRNNTTTSADVTGLSVALSAGKRYCLKFQCLISNTNATPDLKLGMTFSGTFTKVNGYRYGNSPGGALATAYDAAILPVTTAFTTSSIGLWWLDWTYFLDVNTAGTLKVQMAQNTAHASDVTMLAGANIRCRQSDVA